MPVARWGTQHVSWLDGKRQDITQVRQGLVFTNGGELMVDGATRSSTRFKHTKNWRKGEQIATGHMHCGSAQLELGTQGGE
jgi:hypothetical protein